MHDLDLRVTHNSNRLYSNFGAASSGTYAGEEDTQNNVEKTTVASSALSVGDIVVVVVATDSGLAGFDYQNFALAVTGNVIVSTPSPTVSLKPTSMPTPAPSTLPTFPPLPAPSLLPIPAPSKIPIPTPSKIPTLAPTSTDTFSASTAIAIATTQSTISSSESSTLKNTIATTIGVASSYMKNFVVAISPAQRRRRLLASYTWTASFDLVAPLSSTTASSPSEFTETMTASLETNLATNIQNDMGLTATVSKVSSVIATRVPSPLPSKQPSVTVSSPEPTQSSESSDSSISVGALVGIILAGLVVFLGGAAAVFKLYKDQIKMDSAEGMGLEDNPVPSSANSSKVLHKNSGVELMKAAKTPASRPTQKPKSIVL